MAVGVDNRPVNKVMTDNYNALQSSILAHRAELIRVLELVRQDASYPRLKRFPSRYSPYVWSKVAKCEVDPWCDEPQGINHSIRQIHDFYGWMAKHGDRGVCAGALYRTEKFMMLPWEARCGRRGGEKNVHIEHTVPVSVLNKALHKNSFAFKTPADLHWFLISHSVCVAFSQDEEKAMRLAAVPASRNDAFASDGSLLHNYPFRRYAGLVEFLGSRDVGFRIFNVVDGTPLDFNCFSFSDHVETLEKASSLVLNQGPHSSLYSLDLFDSRSEQKA